MKILLSGAGGQLGQQFFLQCARLKNIELLAYTKEQLDITHEDQVKATLEQHKPDCVINAAAYTNVEQAESNKTLAFAINHLGAKNLAIACEQLSIPLVHYSTDYIFDGQKTTPYQEDDTPNPINSYGGSKLLGEQEIQRYCKKHIIIRTSWVFSSIGNNFVKTIVKLALSQPELRVVNDQLGCPTSTCALADASIKVANHITHDFNQWGVYHFCCQPQASWFEFTQEIVAIMQQHQPELKTKVTPIPSSEYPFKAERPPYSVLDINKISNIFNLEPYDWKQDLKKIIQALMQKQEELLC